MPGLSSANATHPPKYELEYVTYPLSSFHPPTNEPVPQHLLPSSLRNLTEAPSSGSNMAPFGMDDLTIPSWLKLARKLAETKENGKPKKKWKLFKKFMYMGKE
jgi:endopolyphosphatase